VAKPEKSTPGKPASGSTDGDIAKMNRTPLLFAAALTAVVVIAGIFYFRSPGEPDPNAPKSDPDVAELMAPGPLEDIVIGKADAPNTIVEYASMTCSHCARFHKEVFPELKQKYIDTGKAKFILREFPLDGLAVAAFMLARCAGPDRYYPMVGGLFESQESWALPGPEGKEKLMLIAKQAGFSQESADKCVADKTQFDKVVEVRQRGHDKFGVDSTPTFFVNGKRLTGEKSFKDFEAALEGKAPSEGTPPPSG
jgi:protein-disulfide isomerase